MSGGEIAIVVSALAVLAGCGLVVVSVRSALARHAAVVGADQDEQRTLLATIDQRMDVLRRTVPEQVRLLVKDVVAGELATHRATAARPDADAAVANAVDQNNEVSDRRLVDQIAHELKTPLAAMKARALIAGGASRAGDPTAVEQEIAGVIEDVRQCESVLLVFGQVVTGLRAGRQSRETLVAAVRGAYDAAAVVFGRGSRLSIGLPAAVPGFPTHYLAAIFRPLVVNAVEHGADAPVTVGLEEEAGALTLFVENRTVAPVKAAMFNINQVVSSKLDHRALGIETVRTLADLRRGGQCRYVVLDGGSSVRAEVRLPKEAM